MSHSVVIMGVAGCGKSSLGASVAVSTGLRLIEGDDYHCPASREKMSRGIALTDADREAWLEKLGQLLSNTAEPVVLTCSALKKIYRDKLRSAAADLRFIYLEISPAEALRRVSARAAEHFFPIKLVDSQFATLEAPLKERGVMTLDATLPLAELCQQAAAWLKGAAGR
jgi:gluconokinase